MLQSLLKSLKILRLQVQTLSKVNKRKASNLINNGFFRTRNHFSFLCSFTSYKFILPYKIIITLILLIYIIHHLNKNIFAKKIEVFNNSILKFLQLSKFFPNAFM